MMSILIMTLVSLACFPLFALHCAWCRQQMLEGDNYCQNCGMKKASAASMEQLKPTPQPTYHSVSRTSPSTSPRQSHISNYHCQSGFGMSDGVCGRFLGMGRGIVAAALSPLNIIRGALTGASWACEAAGLKRRFDGTYYAPNNNDVDAAIAVYMLNSITCPVGTVVGAFTTCADAINGVADLMSAGYYGDWLYDSNLKGHPTPWIWDREWRSSNIPWINR